MVPTRLCSHLWRLSGRTCSLSKAAHGSGSPLLSHHISSASDSSRLLSLTRTSGITVGPLDNPDHLPISRSLATSAKSLSPGNATYSQVPGIKTWTSLGGHSSAYHTEYESMGGVQLSILPFYCGSSTCKPVGHLLGMRST